MTEEALISVAATVSGWAFAAIGWLFRSAMKMRRDIDVAHRRIRTMQERLDKLEES